MNGLAQKVIDYYCIFMGDTDSVYGTISIHDDDYYPNTVLLDYIASWQEIPHSGTIMMETLCYILDLLEINMVLGVSPNHEHGDKHTLNKKQLVHFYRNFGFKALDRNSNSMYRKFKKI